MINARGIERAEIMGDWYEEVAIEAHFQDWLDRQVFAYFDAIGVLPSDAMIMEIRTKFQNGDLTLP